MADNKSTSKFPQNTLVISSAARQSGTPSNFIVSLPSNPPITCINVKRVTFPSSLYNISAALGNNTLDWKDSGAGVQQTVIPDGAYSASALATYLQTQMAIAVAGYTVTFSSTTLKFTIATNGVNTVSLLFASGVGSANSCAFVLGFGTASVAATDTAAATTVTSTYACRLSGPLTLYAVIQEFAAPRQAVMTDGTPLFYTFEIPITTSAGGISEFAQNSWYQQSYTREISKIYNRFTILLFLSNGTVPDLNGQDWEFALDYF